MVLAIPSTRRTVDLVRISPSAANELELSLYVCSKCAMGDTEYEPPAWMEAYLAGNAAVYDQLMRFWEDVPEDDRSEVLILAARSGTLLDPNLDRFFALFDEAAERPLEPGLMAGESEALRGVMSRRMEILRTDPERRRTYRRLLEAHWNALKPTWEKDGRPAVEAACRRFREALEGSHDLRAILPPNHLARMEAYEPLVATAVLEGRVVVAPGYLGLGSQAMVDLPGALLLGVGLEMESSLERMRERARRAADRFKVLSDPTRTAILITLTRHPLSVTDLAERFGFSQPTISVHVKALRQADLLRSERSGNQTLYSADVAAVRAFLDAARRELLPTETGPTST